MSLTFAFIAGAICGVPMWYAILGVGSLYFYFQDKKGGANSHRFKYQQHIRNPAYGAPHLGIRKPLKTENMRNPVYGMKADQAR